ncbi:MAG: hypothetical protein JNM56_32910 [Planctomycetia bacterium]|nr:hypothetical protein [Planctomycetia bacterium]
MSSPNPESANREREFVRFMSRHLVALIGTYYRLDEDGQPSGPHSFVVSGFVIEFRHAWLWATAGHCLRDLDDLVRGQQEGRIAQLQFVLADYFGPSPLDRHPIPFVYEDTVRHAIDDEASGLDYGLVIVSPYYQRLLEANDVIPVSQVNWEHQHLVNFDAFAILGFPSELNRLERRVSGDQEQITISAEPVYMAVQQLPASPIAARTTALPSFVGQLPLLRRIPHVRGMSGCPIFGFRIGDDSRPTQYWIVAMQSSWIEELRVIFGCPVPTFMGLVEAVVDQTDD